MISWQTVELMGYAYYSERGYKILVPLVHNDAYDFVAEKNGEFIRVNVKLAGLKNKRIANSWSVSLASGSAYKTTSGKVDVFLAYLPEHGRFVELPGDFFEGTNSKSRNIPRHMYMI